MVRSIFGPLQLVPNGVRDREVQRRTEGLQDLERDDPVSGGQAAPCRSAEKDGKGALGGERRQEVN